MPEGDQTGPRGEGPRTGRGQAGAQSLEARVSVFDSIGKSLEDLVAGVKAIPKTAKEAAYYTYYAAKPAAAFAGLYFLGGAQTLIHAATMAGGFMAGKLLGKLRNKEKIIAKETYSELSNEATVGAVMGGFLSQVFKGVHYLANGVSSVYGAAAGIATKVASALVSMPVFMTAHEYANRALIGDYKPKSWKERKKQMLKIAAILGIPVVANFAFLPLRYNIPAAAAINTSYGYLKAEPKKEEKAPAQSPQGYGATGPG